jgi:RimJ/RimL family protein N-acetyltransferase
MKLNNWIISKNIRLRTAKPEDAEFVLSLRLNNQLNRYLKKTDPSIEKQRKWIINKQYQENDYHMIIESLKNDKLGIIALYDINKKKKTFDWGRWLVKPNAPPFTAIESNVLIYHLGFNILKLKIAEFEVRKNNESVIKYHLNYGASIFSEDENFVYLNYTNEQFALSSFFNPLKNIFGISY